MLAVSSLSIARRSSDCSHTCAPQFLVRVDLLWDRGTELFVAICVEFAS